VSGYPYDSPSTAPSKVTHLIHGVAGSDLVVELDCDDVAPMFIALLAPLRFLASFFKIPPVSFV